MFLFDLFYIGELESKGYITCKGVPSGWTPGMGTQYVLDLSLCDKKK
nr:Putative uncharacterized protein [Moritella viscosa]